MLWEEQGGRIGWKEEGMVATMRVGDGGRRGLERVRARRMESKRKEHIMCVVIITWESALQFYPAVYTGKKATVFHNNIMLLVVSSFLMTS